MCVEKTPWEQVVDFHGHSCPGVAMGYRIAQIANHELKFQPALEPQIIVEAETRSCALDAFQIINKATSGRQNLIITEKGKHVYKFYYSGNILRIAIKLDILNRMSALKEYTNKREKQNKSLEIIQYILSCEEHEFCTVERMNGAIDKENNPLSWMVCSQCQEPVKEKFTIEMNGRRICQDCS